MLFALDLSLPDCISALTDLSTDLFRHLRRDSVALITISEGPDDQHTGLNRLFSYIGGISIRAHVFLDDVKWHCWLIHRNAEALDTPILVEGWDDEAGDIMLRAVNKSAADFDYMHRLESNSQIHTPALEKALSIAHDAFDLEGRGWTRIRLQHADIGGNDPGLKHQMCLAGGSVSLKHFQPEMTRHIGGVGWSWTEAAFFLTCEAIERAADAIRPFPYLAGIAFGFSKEAATYRAILEFFERYYFTRSFVTDDTPKPLGISRATFLSKACGELRKVNGNKQFYVLSHNELFHVVLALSEYVRNSEAPVYHYGLGCNASLEYAARKALEETVQIHLYAQQTDTNSPQRTNRLTAMSAQGRQCHQFWERSDTKAYFERFSNYSEDTVYAGNATQDVSPLWIEEKGLSQLLSWCAGQNISIRTETLFKSATDCEGWVVRAICSGLPDITATQAGDLASPDKVPFPLLSI